MTLPNWTYLVAGIVGALVQAAHWKLSRDAKRRHSRPESLYPSDRPAILGPLPIFCGAGLMFSSLAAVATALSLAQSGNMTSLIQLAPLIGSSLVIGALGGARLLVAVFHENLPGLREMLSGKRFQGITSEKVLAEALDVSFVGQYGFYSIVASVLWLASTPGEPSVAASLASIVLLFVADDWNIIAGYAGATGGRVRRIDVVKIVVTNVLLFVLSIAAAIQLGGWLAGLMAFIALALAAHFAASYWYGQMHNYTLRSSAHETYETHNRSPQADRPLAGR